MKQKVKIIVSSILIVVLLLVGVGCIGLGILSHNGMGILVGDYIHGKYGDNPTLINFGEDYSMHLIDTSEDKAVFDKVDEGDWVLIVHGGIMETYPPQTNVCKIIVLKENAFEIDYI